MFGAIIGDIIGSCWEFNPTNDYHFELFSESNDFTDDTICTMAIADALLRRNLLERRYTLGVVVIHILWVAMVEDSTSGS